MRYDPESRELFFNTEMVLSEEGSRLNSEHFRDFQYEAVSHPGGSSCTIKIDPDDPSRVMGNCKTYAATPAIFALCALVASIVFTILATR